MYFRIETTVFLANCNLFTRLHATVFADSGKFFLVVNCFKQCITVQKMSQLFRCCSSHVCLFRTRFCPQGVCKSAVRNGQQKVPCSISSHSRTGIEDCLHLSATFCKKLKVQKRTALKVETAAYSSAMHFSQAIST